ncbi:hypothetical protein J6590_088378 [Homalodisca vitripennis]|nr:hypothetical protein J6590_088378 [Homalodisca vitripennis]
MHEATEFIVASRLRSFCVPVCSMGRTCRCQFGHRWWIKSSQHVLASARYRRWDRHLEHQLLNRALGKDIPNHVMRLKVGSVCLIMRNLNEADGLVNGNKVIVTAILNQLITVRRPHDAQPL